MTGNYRDEDEVPEEKCEMTDCVKFYLAKRYFHSSSGPSRNSNTMCRQTCLRILSEIGGLSSLDASSMMDNNPEGFWVYCTPAQFAKFIILRFESNEVINGVRDLKPSIESVYEGVICPVASRVARSLGMGYNRVIEAVNLYNQLKDCKSNRYVDIRGGPPE